MRVKPVPEPPAAPDRVFAVREAVPLVPEPEASCCDRLLRRTDIDDRTDARDWLAFLRGLDLVAEGPSGYHRTREKPEDLGAALLDGVYGAREVRNVLADATEPLTADAVFERFDAVPRWERHRNPDWESIWRERVARLLGWLVVLGLANRRAAGFVRA